MVRNYIIKKEVRKPRIIGRCLCWPSRTLPELPQNVFKDTYPPEKGVVVGSTIPKCL